MTPFNYDFYQLAATVMIKMCPAKAQANILYFMIVINIDYFVSTVSFLKKKIITAIKPY